MTTTEHKSYRFNSKFIMFYAGYRPKITLEMLITPCPLPASGVRRIRQRC